MDVYYVTYVIYLTYSIYENNQYGNLLFYINIVIEKKALLEA